MPLIYRKGIVELMILLFTALSDSGVIAQFKYDLRQELYPPFVRNERSTPEFNWHDHQSTLQDSNVTLLGRWAWGHCYAVAARDHYVYTSNGGAFQIEEALPKSRMRQIRTYGSGRDI